LGEMDMPVKARLYISAIIALGIALLASSALMLKPAAGARFAAYTALACIASTMKMRLPGMTGTLSANFVLVLLAATRLTLPETVILAIIATIVQCTWRSKTKPRLQQVTFNASAVALSAALAHQIAHALPDTSIFVVLVPTASAYFILNTGIVATVLGLISDESPTSIWRRCHLWSFPFYVVGAALAAAVIASDTAAGWRMSLLALPLVYLVYAYYREYLGSRTLNDRTASSLPTQ
jgi:hypothetical protein